MLSMIKNVLRILLGLYQESFHKILKRFRLCLDQDYTHFLPSLEYFHCQQKKMNHCLFLLLKNFPQSFQTLFCHLPNIHQDFFVAVEKCHFLLLFRLLCFINPRLLVLFKAPNFAIQFHQHFEFFRFLHLFLILLFYLTYFLII